MTLPRLVRTLIANVSIALLVFAVGWQTSASAKTADGGSFDTLPKAQQKSLDELERRTFEYFYDSANASNGQMPDHWPQRSESDSRIGRRASSCRACGCRPRPSGPAFEIA